MQCEIGISPGGVVRLFLEVERSGLGAFEQASVSRDLTAAFDESSAAGLSLLASARWNRAWPAPFDFWRRFACRYFTSLRRHFAQTARRWSSPPVPDADTLAEIVAAAPPMIGLEYLKPETAAKLWRELDDHTRQAVAAQQHDLPGYLSSLDPAWTLVGRVTFHLAENKRDPKAPFAFLATYTESQSSTGSPQHIPLSQALQNSVRQRDAKKLEVLLEPVTRAARKSPLIADWLSSRALFAPQSLTIRQAYQFLQSVPELEEAGVIVRVPDWWNASRPTRPQVAVTIGTNPGTSIVNPALKLDVQVAIDGQPLSEAELQQLLEAREGLSLLRGKWVEVDRQRLQSALNHWRELQRGHVGGMDFLQAMRLLAGVPIDGQSADHDQRAWSRVAAGPWLEETLRQLRDPSLEGPIDPQQGLNASLRPYQVRGVQWLWFATRMGLGVCLADDMGLGKTLQIIALVNQWKRSPSGNRLPTLLIVPTSLLGNWQREVARFAPQLRLLVAHRSVTDAQTLARLVKAPEEHLKNYDLVATTYGLARTSPWLADCSWQLVVLDEAQAIKNSAAAQTRAIKKIPGKARIVLTGTPIENHLGDLWSLFDFCAPGLLGSATAFKKFAESAEGDEQAWRLATLRRLIRPYVLRRMKTDPNVAPDLPAKTEMRVDCGLTATQAALYQAVVRELSKSVESSTGMRRRGLVLAALTQLKQICNHPALYLKQAQFESKASGKYSELAEIAFQVRDKQEKVLIFTQYQQMCHPLAEFLAALFRRPGLILTGQTAAARRSRMVAEFQQEDGPPFFVISVKAGGTGLNLTQACHVIHFDRWWNPAVEDQATDRAFRIGQTRHVLVHKFVCRGTIEERIDEMILSKRSLSRELLAPDGDINLTEMSDQQLMEFVTLDLKKATGA